MSAARPSTVCQMHDKFACKFLAQTLTDGLQRVLRHNLEREFAHVAERSGILNDLVDIKQQQAPDLRGFLLSPCLFSEEMLIYPRFTFVFEALHVIARGIDEVIGELTVALPDITQQI